MLTLTLPWPPRELSPNTRHAHWSIMARAKRRYRSACALLARSQGASKLDVPELAVSMIFVPPDRRRRDLDNCISSMKAGLDGLADVLGVDDNRWTMTAVMDHSRVGGFVSVEVAAWPG
jgi:crossover junction endodeoxyribonuclease RusA